MAVLTLALKWNAQILTYPNRIRNQFQLGIQIKSNVVHLQGRNNGGSSGVAEVIETLKIISYYSQCHNCEIENHSSININWSF